MTYSLPTLRIESPDRKSWLELRPWCDDSGCYNACEFEVAIDYGHGRFHGQNSDVQFLDLYQFAADLERFITERSLQPTLMGTYDSILQFRSWGTEVGLAFCLGNTYCGGLFGTEDTRLRASFCIDSEYLNSIAAFFTRWTSLKL
jgi:hypothetical protein